MALKNAYQQADQRAEPLGYQQISSATLASATALTLPSETPHGAWVICETQSVRWRDDGTDPTTSEGMLLPVNVYLWFSIDDLSNLRFIRTAAGAILNVSYYG